MIVEGKEIILRESFLDSLIEFQNYYGLLNPVKGRKFVKEAYDFTIDIIAPMPYAFVKFSTKLYPNSNFRRAVFKKNHIIVYLVLEHQIEFWEIFHASKNPDAILLYL